MSIIRKATIDDLDQIVEMANRFIAFAPHGSLIKHTTDDIVNTVRLLLESGIIFVIDVDGKAVGILAAMMTSVWYSPSTKVAHEMMWWVNEEHRGTIASIKLIKAYENWAQENGANLIAMCDLVIEGQEPVGTTLNRLGYEMSERTYIKGVK
jgi:hypothetical protein